MQDEAKQRAFWRGIKNRMCIMIYGDGNTSNERRQFRRDCNELLDALTDTVDTAEPYKCVVSVEQFDSCFLNLLARREQQIMENLPSELKNQIYEWNLDEKMIRDLLLHVRCIKAMDTIGESWCKENRTNKLTKSLADYVLKDLVQLWKDNRGIRITKEVVNSTANNRSTGESSNVSSRFTNMTNYIKNYITAPHVTEKGRAQILSREIFDQSLYLPRFPVITKLSPEYISLFKDSLIDSKCFETISDEICVETRQTEFDDKLFRVATTLVKKLKEHAEEQWIWIHYSGHKDELEKHAKKFSPMVKLTCELFTNVVVSMDCCYPECLNDEDEPHNLCAILPHKGDHEIPLGKGCSPFTQLLRFALCGFQPAECHNEMNRTCGNYDDLCGCSTCNEYKASVHSCTPSPYPPKEESIETQIYLMKVCSKCKQLWLETQPFIYPIHVKQYLESHLCKYKFAPRVSGASEHPLMLQREFKLQQEER